MTDRLYYGYLNLLRTSPGLVVVAAAALAGVGGYLIAKPARIPDGLAALAHQAAAECAQEQVAPRGLLCTGAIGRAAELWCLKAGQSSDQGCIERTTEKMLDHVSPRP